MKLWIIYKEGIGFSKIVAEMLQDHLEEYIDLSVGNAKKIDPCFIVEERLDYLILGDTISDTISSLEIRDWLIKYWESAKKSNLFIRAVSGFYVMPTHYIVEPSWIEFLQDNVNNVKIYPPILRLKLNITEMALEGGALELIRDYSNDFIDYFFE